jgi:hypothetical protein
MSTISLNYCDWKAAVLLVDFCRVSTYVEEIIQKSPIISPIMEGSKFQCNLYGSYFVLTCNHSNTGKFENREMLTIVKL